MKVPLKQQKKVISKRNSNGDVKEPTFEEFDDDFGFGDDFDMDEGLGLDHELGLGDPRPKKQKTVSEYLKKKSYREKRSNG